jgi:hypothetical protein
MPSWYQYEKLAAFIAGGVNDGPKVYYPSEQEPPQCRSKDELQRRHKEPALNQLAQTGDEEAANGGNNVAG